MRFLKKSEILGVHLGDVLTSKIVYFRVQGPKRVSKMKVMLKAFWHRFCDDFRGPGNVKNEQKRGRVAFFLIFGSRSGAVLGGSGGGFSELFGRFWLDFGVFKRRPILKPKLEAEKVVPDTRGGFGRRFWRP